MFLIALDLFVSIPSQLNVCPFLNLAFYLWIYFSAFIYIYIYRNFLISSIVSPIYRILFHTFCDAFFHPPLFLSVYFFYSFFFRFTPRYFINALNKLGYQFKAFSSCTFIVFRLKAGGGAVFFLQIIMITLPLTNIEI